MTPITTSDFASRVAALGEEPSCDRPDHEQDHSMRRITLWLSVALTVGALAFCYNLSLSGDGKAGDEGDHGAPPAAAVVPATATTTTSPAQGSVPATTTAPAQAAASTSTTTASSGDDVHVDKPGESK